MQKNKRECRILAKVMMEKDRKANKNNNNETETKQSDSRRQMKSLLY